jgi:hypothetical protein
MDLAELQKIGGFVPSEPVKVKVDWNPPEGEPVSFDVHVRKLSAGALERLWVDTRTDQSSSATMISTAVLLGDKADQRLTYDQAFQLEPSLATALLEAVDQVNPRKKRTVAAAKN